MLQYYCNYYYDYYDDMTVIIVLLYSYATIITL